MLRLLCLPPRWSFPFPFFFSLLAKMLQRRFPLFRKACIFQSAKEKQYKQLKVALNKLIFCSSPFSPQNIGPKPYDIIT